MLHKEKQINQKRVPVPFEFSTKCLLRSKMIKSKCKKNQFSYTASLWICKNELSSIFQAEGKQSVSCVCLCRHLETEERASLHQSAAWNKSLSPNSRTSGTGPPAPLRSEEQYCSSMMPSCGLQRGRIHKSRRDKRRWIQ